MLIPNCWANQRLSTLSTAPVSGSLFVKWATRIPKLFDNTASVCAVFLEMESEGDL